MPPKLVAALDFSAHPPALPLDAVLVAVRVGDERGGSALIAGGSPGARRALTERIAQALDREGSPGAPGALWVTVQPRSGLHGGRGSALLEDLHAAVEQRLTEVHAPGGLYDAPGRGALAPLGGWLFRARAAGFRGIILCLPEIEGWIDARGVTPADAHTPRGLDVLASALDECAERQVSVLVTVRASDASGTPSLPGELLARFGRVERLGGASTVSRDPSVLLAAVAGRSFTLAALKNALAGWLELGDADGSTVVAFTSPLAPTALPAAAPFDAALPSRDHEPTNEPLALSPGPRAHEPAEHTAQPPSRPVAPVRPPAAAHPPHASPWAPDASTAPPESWSRAVRAAVEAREALRVLRDLGAPQGFRQFERAYRDAVSRLPLALAALEQGEIALGMEGTRLRAEGRAAIARYTQAFGEFYPAAFDAWMAGSARPAMLCDLPGFLSRAAAEHGARGTALVVCTGLRLDAWRRLRAHVLPEVPGVELLTEGVLWAARPTTPATQRELLVRGLSALRGPLPRRDELPVARTLDEALRPRRENLGQVEIVRLDGYAVELAHTAASLPDALGVIETALPAALRAVCNALPRRTIVAITGDVGMREVTRRDDEKERGRFAFGGDSPFEAVVPYAMLSWSAGPLNHG